MIRQPIVTVLGHVDHGKTTLLDFIRESRVQMKEAGGLTQHIGATEIPSEFIKKQCSYFLKKLGIDITIPGLLFIDTPGHEAFMNLRRRGGSLADMAIIVIDVKEGIQPQTAESIEILKHFKVPFVIAANKIDLVPGWDPDKHACFINSWELQSEDARIRLEEKLFEIMGELAQKNIDSERFDKVSDFTQQVAIIPTCAETGEGVMDLLAVIAGLAQRFLKKKLKTTKGPAKATILEIKEEKGLGKVFDSIVYEGTLKVGDNIIVGTPQGTEKGKVRLLLKPKELDEMRDPTDRFDRVDDVTAASGIRIVTKGCEEAIAGSLLLSEEVENAEEEISEDLEHVKLETQGSGIVLKADALGSLEAIAGLIQDREIPIRLADIGDVSRKDVVEAENAMEEDPLTSAIIAFHVNVLPDAEKLANDKGIKIIQGKIIYRLLEEYSEWVERRKKVKREEDLGKLIRGAKFRLLPGYVFRESNPAVVGVEVLGGLLKPGIRVMKEDGSKIGDVKQIQDQGEPVSEANKGMEVAVSIEGPTVGRQIEKNDVLYSIMPESNYKSLKKFEDMLANGEMEVLEEIKEIMKKIKRKTWGM